MCPINKFIMLLAILTSGTKIKSTESHGDSVECYNSKQAIKDLIETSTVILKAFVGNKFLNVTDDKLMQKMGTTGHVHNQQIHKNHDADVVNDGINHDENINYVQNDKNVGYFIITLAPIVVYKGTFLLRHLEMFNNQQYFIVKGQLNATLEHRKSCYDANKNIRDNNLHHILPGQLIVFGRLDNKNNLLVHTNGLVEWSLDIENLIWNYLGWSQWSDYTACSIPCGKGVQQRYRHCLNKNTKNHYPVQLKPAKHHDDVDLEKFNASSSSPYCEGYNIEQRDCNIFKCIDEINLLTLHKLNPIKNARLHNAVSNKLNQINKNFTIMMTLTIKKFHQNTIVSLRSQQNAGSSFQIALEKRGLKLTQEENSFSESIYFNKNLFKNKFHQIAVNVQNGDFITFFIDCGWHQSLVLSKGSISMPKDSSIAFGNIENIDIHQLSILPGQHVKQQCSTESTPIMDFQNKMVVDYFEKQNRN